MHHLQQHWQSLNANIGENGPEQMLLYEGDVRICFGIIKFR
jgi:hypothetical protein